MGTLLRNEIKKTFRRKETMILLLLGLWPMLLSVLVVIKPDVFTMEGNALGAFEFANYMVIIQNDVFLPLLATTVVASTSFYQELAKKTIYLYKDISRRKIINIKYVSVYCAYFAFLIIYTIVAFLAYYLVFRYHVMATGTFIAYPIYALEILYSVIQIILGATFYIHVGIIFAIRTSTGVTVFGMTMFYMVARIVPHFPLLKYVFPIGYREVIELGSHPFICSMLLSIVIYTIYHIALYMINQKRFAQLQFN